MEQFCCLKNIFLWKKSVIILFSALFAVCMLGCDKTEEKTGPVYSDKNVSQGKAKFPFALIPIYNPTRLHELYGPVVDGLNQLIPEAEFTMETSKDFNDYENKIRTGLPAILIPNHLQALIALKFKYHVILKGITEGGIRGLLIVRKDSGINKPNDLKGKSVSYPSPTALLASVMTQQFLFSQGIDINRDITNLYVGSMDSAIMNVFLKQTAAGGAYTIAWNAFQKDRPKEAEALKVMWETEPIMVTVVLLRNDIPKPIQKKITEYFIGLKNTAEGRELLARLAVTEYQPANDMDMMSIRKIIDEFELNIRPIEGFK